MGSCEADGGCDTCVACVACGVPLLLLLLLNKSSSSSSSMLNASASSSFLLFITALTRSVHQPPVSLVGYRVPASKRQEPCTSPRPNLVDGIAALLASRKCCYAVIVQHGRIAACIQQHLHTRRRAHRACPVQRRASFAVLHIDNICNRPRRQPALRLVVIQDHCCDGVLSEPDRPEDGRLTIDVFGVNVSVQIQQLPHELCRPSLVSRRRMRHKHCTSTSGIMHTCLLLAVASGVVQQCAAVRLGVACGGQFRVLQQHHCQCWSVVAHQLARRCDRYILACRHLSS
ncbi:hypothetical protein BC831DRAFT_243381 [Entophlyctis helioformis]|nr:hypothetical protein BC831DRAFT_243381 [Entophlyctis helioformis]